jgi:hypothetical protein
MAEPETLVLTQIATLRLDMPGLRDEMREGFATINRSGGGPSRRLHRPI